MTLEELKTELKRLADWWATDASYRPPEDPLFPYALGNRDALLNAVRMIENEVKDG
jgi:hypothetical protein